VWQELGLSNKIWTQYNKNRTTHDIWATLNYFHAWFYFYYWVSLLKFAKLKIHLTSEATCATESCWCLWQILYSSIWVLLATKRWVIRSESARAAGLQILRPYPCLSHSHECDHFDGHRFCLQKKETVLIFTQTRVRLFRGQEVGPGSLPRYDFKFFFLVYILGGGIFLGT